MQKKQRSSRLWKLLQSTYKLEGISVEKIKKTLGGEEFSLKSFRKDYLSGTLGADYRGDLH